MTTTPERVSDERLAELISQTVYGESWREVRAALRELQSRREVVPVHEAALKQYQREQEADRAIIATLRAEVERLTSDRDAKSKRMWELGHECDALHARIASLEARNAEMEKDAACLCLLMFIPAIKSLSHG